VALQANGVKEEYGLAEAGKQQATAAGWVGPGQLQQQDQGIAPSTSAGTA